MGLISRVSSRTYRNFAQTQADQRKKRQDVQETRSQRQEDLRPEVRPVPRHGRGQAPQAGSQPLWHVRPTNRTSRGLQIHRSQQGKGHHLERRDPGHLLDQPEKVHPRHQDGLRWSDQEARAQGPDRLPQDRAAVVSVETDGDDEADFPTGNSMFSLKTNNLTKKFGYSSRTKLGN